ncbi:MAG: CHASE2 domain-containing protein [Candidatus Tectomicrobia bacterium]|uniref:CHASE2 domain-containing protein n=1 Tax=Tectimicrobiota bacterium TaxID=2528274 RepID=A0A932GLT2_UNCTE|nr:CHASE2 domain-containing protein [Candidatus Tectomicrobia bacterium]
MGRRFDLRAPTAGPPVCSDRDSTGPFYAGLIFRLRVIFAFVCLALFCTPAASFSADAPPLVIVDIDDASLGKFGRWPWPRDLQARLLRGTQKFSPRAVVLDLLFSEEDAQFPEKDRDLAEVIGSGGNVFLAFAFQFGIPGAAPEPERTALLRNHALARGREWDDVLREASSVLFPLPQFARKAAGLGFVNVFPESREGGPGLVRKATLAVSYEGKVYPSLPLAVAMWLRNRTPSNVVLRLGDRIEMGEVNIRIDSAGDIPLAFSAPGTRFSHVSAARVLDGEDFLSLFRGAIVIIGVNATGLSDYHPTPVSFYYPGMELLATAIDALLSRWPSPAR